MDAYKILAKEGLRFIFYSMAILFGPVKSRRLGLSLGVELVPKKICSMDCLYCEVGKTDTLTLIRAEYIPWDEIERALYLAKEREGEYDVLTFTGSGEPTLNIHFERAIYFAKSLIKKPIAVLTNSSTIHLESVRKALAEVDLVLASLDCALDKSFKLLNRPVKELKLSTIIEGLKGLREIMKGELWLEVLFVKGINDQPEDLRALKEAISKIKPHKVQLNTVVRPPAYRIAQPLTFEELERIMVFLGEGAEIITPKEKILKPLGIKEDLNEKILDYLARRPAPLSELTAIFGENKEFSRILEELVSAGKLKRVLHQKEIFYST
jgi:wyosine [tRNA(Phe)-imidazoG37] synthetase (radical SAM superfamily)